MLVRQSVKFIILSYVLCGILELVILVYWFAFEPPAGVPFWMPLLLPIALQLITAVRHVQRISTKLTISGDRLRWESGLVSKSTRSMELAKIQDVRVDQSIWQRIANIGNLSLETAGGSSRIVMPSVDQPQKVADHILEMAGSPRTDGKTV